MRPKGSAAVLEARRRRGLRLLDQGRSLNEVARLLDCAPSSVMRWRDAHDAGGEEALRVRFSGYFAQSERPFRAMVNARFAHGERVGATLVPSSVFLGFLLPA